MNFHYEVIDCKQVAFVFVTHSLAVDDLNKFVVESNFVIRKYLFKWVNPNAEPGHRLMRVEGSSRRVDVSRLWRAVLYGELGRQSPTDITNKRSSEAQGKKDHSETKLKRNILNSTSITPACNKWCLFTCQLSCSS